MLPVATTGSSEKFLMAAIGEASRRSGVGIETIRYYEREGIVPLPERLQNGRRNYSQEEIANLKFIKRCRDLGFALQDAGTLLSVSHSENVDCGEVLKFGVAQLAAVRSKIAELRNLELALTELTSNCTVGLSQCPMLEQMRSD